MIATRAAPMRTLHNHIRRCLPPVGRRCDSAIPPGMADYQRYVQESYHHRKLDIRNGQRHAVARHVRTSVINVTSEEGGIVSEQTTLGEATTAANSNASAEQMR